MAGQDESEGGVDITPLYRAAARSTMIQGAISIGIGVIAAAILPALGLVFFAGGAVRVFMGLVQYLRYQSPR